MDLLPQFVLSGHARERGARRNISPEIVGRVLMYADSRVHVGGGVKACMITRRRLNQLCVANPLTEFERLESIVVLFDPANRAVITVFRAIGRASKRYRRHMSANERH